MLTKRINYIIFFCLVISIIIVQGCAFGLSSKEAEIMLQEVTKNITKAGDAMATNDVKEVRIENVSGIDAAVFCQAYIPAAELESRLRSLQLPSTTMDTIQSEVSAQDGIYLFLLKKGRIIAKGPLGGEVSLSEPVLGLALKDALLLEIIRLDQKWRYLQIRREKGSDLNIRN